jgi:SAM-dependent methyltransferase
MIIRYYLVSHTDFVMMNEFWEKRFSQEAYVYGKEPNAFFRECIDGLTPGKVLLPGEGEGRNAVYAAGLGWDVHAFDQSAAGREKAFRLARERGVHIAYELGSIFDIPYRKGFFDLAALIFMHIHPKARRMFHNYIMNSLGHGGLLVMEAFGKEQIRNASGGPRDPDLLYMPEDIIEDFEGMEIIRAANERVHLDEGPSHQGEADVVRFIARKK